MIHKNTVKPKYNIISAKYISGRLGNQAKQDGFVNHSQINNIMNCRSYQI